MSGENIERHDLTRNKILWVMSRRQRDVNSATELGRELLEEEDVEVFTFSGFPVFQIAALFSRARATRAIYYQFGTPIENIMIAFLVLLKRALIVHYLDNIMGGYPRWARIAQLHLPIAFLLRQASGVIAISPEMKKWIEETQGRKQGLFVYYRRSADAPPQSLTRPVDYPDTVVFAGNINPKTNLQAVIDAQRKLEALGFKLVVFSRTDDPNVLRELASAGIRLKATIPSCRIIEEIARYRAQLLPFNVDDKSYEFYKLSTPSKLPNMFFGARPIVIHGRKDYWLLKWLESFPDMVIDLNRIQAVSDLPSIAGARDAAKAVLQEFRRDVDEPKTIFQ
ncbi:MAG: hypothetical protein H6918_05355 [Sphingomonadaceae bacterium]|nr:hypothetical protein [Sphingomonadaceae bacterium]